jgi:hypothetical protein
MRLHREGTQAGWQARGAAHEDEWLRGRPGGQEAMMTAAAGGRQGDGLRTVVQPATTLDRAAGLYRAAAGAASAAASGGLAVSATTSSSASASHASSVAQTFPFGEGAAAADDTRESNTGGGLGGGQGFALPQQITGSPQQEALKVMISTTTADSLEKILDWAQYHRLIGVDYFFIFVEGKAAAPEVVEELRKFPGMKVWEPSEDLDAARSKVGLYTSNPAFTHSSKAPGFNSQT